MLKLHKYNFFLFQSTLGTPRNTDQDVFKYGLLANAPQLKNQLSSSMEG